MVINCGYSQNSEHVTDGDKQILVNISFKHFSNYSLVALRMDCGLTAVHVSFLIYCIAYLWGLQEVDKITVQAYIR